MNGALYRTGRSAAANGRTRGDDNEDEKKKSDVARCCILQGAQGAQSSQAGAVACESNRVTAAKASRLLGSRGMARHVGYISGYIGSRRRSPVTDCQWN